MPLSAIIRRWLAGPLLTRPRIWFAFAVAVITDGIQLGLGPLGWTFIDEGMDIVAMLLITAALGFHLLLLPTFVLELLPVTDMLPTWTGCAAAVVMLRKRAQAQVQRPPPPQGTVLSSPALPPPSAAPPTSAPPQTSPSPDKPPRL